MKRWARVFRMLGNVNRTQIIKILSSHEKLSVSEIAKILDISLKATSKHLIMLENFGVLLSQGKDGRVYYWLSPDMPKDIRTVSRLFV